MPVGIVVRADPRLFLLLAPAASTGCRGKSTNVD
jgi:hypothetical protein